MRTDRFSRSFQKVSPSFSSCRFLYFLLLSLCFAAGEWGLVSSVGCLLCGARSRPLAKWKPALGRRWNRIFYFYQRHIQIAAADRLAWTHQKREKNCFLDTRNNNDNNVKKKSRASLNYRTPANFLFSEHVLITV